MANLAVKVADLDAACAFYRAAGADVRDRMAWNGGERADVHLGAVMITLFTRALYEDVVELPSEGFLHPALFTDDLDAELAGHDVIWGPDVVEGPFGRRRIALVNAPGGIRLEVYLDGEMHAFHALDDDWASSFRESGRHWLRWLRTGDGPLWWSAEEAVDVLRFALAVYASSEAGGVGVDPATME